MTWEHLEVDGVENNEVVSNHQVEGRMMRIIVMYASKMFSSTPSLLPVSRWYPAESEDYKEEITSFLPLGVLEHFRQR
jgi:hypothetical protein